MISERFLSINVMTFKLVKVPNGLFCSSASFVQVHTLFKSMLTASVQFRASKPFAGYADWAVDILSKLKLVLSTAVV